VWLNVEVPTVVLQSSPSAYSLLGVAGCKLPSTFLSNI